jgi:hypothetical protein
MPKKPQQTQPSTDETSSELLAPVEHRAWRSELTVELIDELVAAGMAGALKVDVALSCCVPPDLFEVWLDEGMRYDAPALMRELSVRFLCSRKRVSIALSERVLNAALNGDNKLALELLERQNAHWGKDPDRKERDNCAPELSIDVRKRLLVESMRKPRGELREVLIEAGYAVPEDSVPSPDSGLGSLE